MGIQAASSEVWLPIREAAALLGYADPRPLRRDIRLYPKKYVTDFVQGETGMEYKVQLSSLPPEARLKYHGASAETLPAATPDEVGADITVYQKAPQHAKRKADKYKTLLTLTEGLKGRELENFIACWNVQYPDQRTSYPALMAARKAYRAEGLPALLSKHGQHRAGETSVLESWWEFYRSEVMKEGGPPLMTCWEMTLGYALEHTEGLSRRDFPSHKAFERLLKKRIGESALYRARAGYSKWYRKFAQSIHRNYDEIRPGDLWVSDHAQLDVMVTLPNGRTCRPWLTVWMDVKSAKVLGWSYHAEAPNSDHIFQAFYNAAIKYGLPREIYIDNGKDYRALDLSGGRTSHLVQVDEGKALALFALLDIIVHFALPYNAQSKTVERRFLEVKNRFSRALPGFTGGNVVERPEELANQIRLGKLMTLDQAEPLVETYITGVYNLRASQGKVLQGQSPDSYYAAHAPAPRTITADALMLFCMRICTGPSGMGIKIGRDGVKDSQLGIHYWAEWMNPIKGQRVYLRRDPKAYQTAWVFNADTHAYLGQAVLYSSVHMIARGDVQKADLQERMAQKRREQKMVESFMKGGVVSTPEERMKYLATGTRAISGSMPVTTAPAGAAVEITAMDHAVAEEKRNASLGAADISRARPAEPARKKIHLFPFQAREAEEEERRQAGA